MRRMFQAARAAAVCCLIPLIPAVQAQSLQGHVVPLGDLHQQAMNAAEQRRQNLAKLDQFFSTEGATAALRTINMNGQQVHNAVALLSDSDIAMLSERASHANMDFVAGALDNQQLTYIVIALATAVLILVIIAA